MPLSQFDERVVFVSPSQFANGTAASILSAAGGTGYGTRIDQMLLTWTGASPFEVNIRLNDGFGDVAYVGTLTIPAAVGTVMGQVDVITALMPAGQQYIMLNAGGSVEVETKVAITGTDLLSIYAQGGNF